jgi:polysaccharide export outer membrane protein
MKYLVVLCAASLIAAPVQVALAAPASEGQPSGASQPPLRNGEGGGRGSVAQAATIRPGETLDIQIAGDTALSKNYTVDAAGQITLDLIGAVTVAGRTPAQVAADLQTRLSRFLKLRSVTVRPVAAAAQEVTVTGAVVTPGVVRLRPGSGLLDLLAMVGGLAPSADPSKATLVRRGEEKQLPLNIEALLKGDLAQNTPLSDGDIIQIPRRELASCQIFGEVRQPGTKAINGSPTILDAIMECGGFTERADRTRITITRKGLPEPIAIDLEQALAGDSGSLVTLQAGDVVQVGARLVVGVGGEVRTPGQFMVRAGGTLMEAISMAGGFGPDADRDAIQVTHRDGTTDTFKLSGVTTVVGGPELRQGDLLIVGRSQPQVVMVNGPVRAPGAVRYQKDMKLTELLMGVGLAETADWKKIRLVRGEGDKRQVIAFNLEAYLKNSKLENPALQPNDQVFVEMRRASNNRSVVRRLLEVMPLAGLFFRF